MVPAMMSSCSFFSSSVRPAGSFDSKSWKLESLTPSFFSVPTYGVGSKSPLEAAMAVSYTETSIAFMIETRVMSVTDGSATARSVSTPSMRVSLPLSLMAAAALL